MFQALSGFLQCCDEKNLKALLVLIFAAKKFDWFSREHVTGLWLNQDCSDTTHCLIYASYLSLSLGVLEPSYLDEPSSYKWQALEISKKEKKINWEKIKYVPGVNLSEKREGGKKRRERKGWEGQIKGLLGTGGYRILWAFSTPQKPSDGFQRSRLQFLQNVF